MFDGPARKGCRGPDCRGGPNSPAAPFRVKLNLFLQQRKDNPCQLATEGRERCRGAEASLSHGQVVRLPECIAAPLHDGVEQQPAHLRVTGCTEIHADVSRTIHGERVGYGDLDYALRHDVVRHHQHTGATVIMTNPGVSCSKNDHFGVPPKDVWRVLDLNASRMANQTQQPAGEIHPSNTRPGSIDPRDAQADAEASIGQFPADGDRPGSVRREGAVQGDRRQNVWRILGGNDTGDRESDHIVGQIGVGQVQRLEEGTIVVRARAPEMAGAIVVPFQRIDHDVLGNRWLQNRECGDLRKHGEHGAKFHGVTCRRSWGAACQRKRAALLSKRVTRAFSIRELLRPVPTQPLQPVALPPLAYRAGVQGKTADRSHQPPSGLVLGRWNPCTGQAPCSRRSALRRSDSAGDSRCDERPAGPEFSGEAVARGPRQPVDARAAKAG